MSEKWKWYVLIVRYLPAVEMSRRNANAYPVSPKLRNKLLVCLG
nr:MAG TPA: hypothetical protein [Caudoviricetes sp.]